MPGSNPQRPAMSRWESALVHIAVGVLCPLAGFFLGWWSAGALTIYRVRPLSEAAIATAALTGFAAGLILDCLFLRRWAATFYAWDLRLLVWLYLCGSVVAVALFMGFPLGNLAWGTLAGVYLGRRQRYGLAAPQAFQQAAQRVSLFTASVTALEALPIGFMALHEGIVVRILQAATGWSARQIAGPPGAMLVTALCLALMVLQMWLTRTAATIAFGPQAAAAALR
jgi:hypothetical protein